MAHMEVNSHITGYHVYKTEWVPFCGETLCGEREPSNVEDQYAVCVKRNGRIVGHIDLLQSYSFFLRADQTACCEVIVTGQPLNLGDMQGQKVLCMIRFKGRE